MVLRTGQANTKRTYAHSTPASRQSPCGCAHKSLYSQCVNPDELGTKSSVALFTGLANFLDPFNASP